MLAVLLAFPVFGLLLIIQSTILSQLPMLHGTADLVMLALIAWSLQEKVTTAWYWAIIAGLMVSYVSALPLFTPLIGFLVITGLSRLLQRRVWQVPLLAMVFSASVGTLVYQGLALVMLQIRGDPIPIVQSLSIVTLPSLLLNVILAIPMYSLVRDVAGWIYPVEIEE